MFALWWKVVLFQRTSIPRMKPNTTMATIYSNFPHATFWEGLGLVTFMANRIQMIMIYYNDSTSIHFKMSKIPWNLF